MLVAVNAPSQPWRLRPALAEQVPRISGSGRESIEIVSIPLGQPRWRQHSASFQHFSATRQQILGMGFQPLPGTVRCLRFPSAVRGA